MENESVIENLEHAKSEAWAKYHKLVGPANEAYKAYSKASSALKEEQLYQKAKRQVMRDLIASAGKY